MHVVQSFRPDLFRFLRDLAKNNDRDWFRANRERYEEAVRGPALEFIESCAEPLAKITPHVRGDARPVGGSLFRIHRDVRFSRDPSPYKTFVGIHFRHESARDVHAPGYYLHLEPGNCFVSAGLWRPTARTARLVRDTMVDIPDAWKIATRSKPFRESFSLGGESLKRPPAGFEPDHPLVEDLKRKDFVGIAKLTQTKVTWPDFHLTFVWLCRRSRHLMRFLCDAVSLPF